ncbi:MAG: hypothetical protein R3C59_30505 [Planctomycetaceae bacterium]
MRKAFEQAAVVVGPFMLSGSPTGPLLLVDTRKSDVERVREIVEQFIADHPAHGGQPQNAPVPEDAVTRELKFQHVKPLQVLPRVEEELRSRGMWPHNINDNRFQVTGTPEGLDRLEQKAKELDIAENAEAWAKLPAQGRKVLNLGGAGPGMIPHGFPPTVFDNRSQPRLDPLEQRALELARTLRDAGQPTDEQKAQLQKLVTQSLEARLQQLATQVQQLTEKLEKVRSALEQRQQNKDRIIQRRVEELLDPSVDWETLTSTPNRTPPAATPIGLPGTPHLPYGASVRKANDAISRSSNPDQFSPGGTFDVPSEAENIPELTELKPRAELFEELKKAYRRADLTRESMRKSQAATKSDSEDNAPQAEQEVKRLQSTLNEAMTDWKQVWRDYESGIRVLEIDVEEAKTRVANDLEQCERMRRLAAKAAVAANEVQEREATLALSQLGRRRAEERLALYKSIIEDAPHLDPGQFK